MSKEFTFAITPAALKKLNALSAIRMSGVAHDAFHDVSTGAGSNAPALPFAPTTTLK